MSFKENLIKARSHIAFILGLSFAAGFALSVESRVNVDAFRTGGSTRIYPSEAQLTLAPQSPLSPRDLENARIAWRYFEKNTQTQTGLVNSVDGFPSTTIWDQGSYILGLISAERIGIVDKQTFDDRLSRVLGTLARLPLFDGKLPNKAYDTRSTEMVDYSNAATPGGIGWSALDVARISVPLNIILYDYPLHASNAAKVLSHWNFAAMIRDGQLFGSRLADETGVVEIVQEGRLGYEEYAARAVGLLGLDAMNAALYEDFLQFKNVGKQSIAVDSRSHTQFDAHVYVVSEPYLLTALEFGFDTSSKELAQRIYMAQSDRYQATGQLTAVSEDNIDQAPYFIYNSVFANGKAWNALAEDGSQHDDKRTISTKAVFGWDAVFATEYTDRLMRHIAPTATENTGFYSGIYEEDNRLNAVATANTNGVILEAIQYKLNGPLLTARFESKR